MVRGAACLRRVRLAACAAFCLGIAACATAQDRQQAAAEAQIAAHNDAQCRSQGHEPGTDAYKSCIATLVSQQKAITDRIALMQYLAAHPLGR